MNDKDLETILSDDYPIDDEDIDNDENEQNSVSSSKNNVELPSLKYSMYRPLEPCQGRVLDIRSTKKRTRVNPERAETRIGCKARMYLKRANDKWVVSSFVTDHNHELLTPKSTSFLRGHRVITHAQKNLIDTLNEAGVPPRKIMSVLTKESGGDWNAGCVPIDVQNYLGSKRRKLLAQGDAQKLLHYFIQNQSKNPWFFYAIQVDENGHMGNCFWADARSRLAYRHFGDVVTFDATYLTNCYGMPFVPFTGVNHHHQSVMFGCALLVNKKIESYVWLLETWLEAMLGQAPTTIITDDCPSMKNAIAQVLPNTTHKLCMWHILQKVPEHLAFVYNKHPLFKDEFHSCIHDTMTIDEFEFEWNVLLATYGLEENGWMKYLYMRREKWVPAFLRTTFCAGMSTTQRSESMNKFFKDYVRSSTLVSDFVHQYDKALNARYQKEKEKDVKTKSSKAILKTCYKMEADAGKHYTRKMFSKFQDELFSSQNYRASKDRDDGEKKIYKVIPHGKEKPIHEVSLDISDNKTICTCHKFEFVGILCRHILVVFVKKSLVNSLPKCFILERWTIDAKRHTIPDIAGVDVIQADTQISSTLMRNSLMMQFLEVAENGSKSRRKYEHLSHSLQRIHEEILAISDENEENLEASVPTPNFEATNLDESNIVMTLQDPLHVRSRGRPKSLRAKNPKENQSKPSGIKRKCTMCKAEGHNKTTCLSLKPSLTAEILFSSAVGVK
ncbi:hypothetical protein CCACVL1_12374 [Corchorus capsularis]|uniref:Protein FAR1-RELATED SEQUENCE n=1 Tax=Corchorus capsularis TaxID=210143 RepID=A0A1R3IG13_COCAP|nr:hypothetical protein CCACVL1_12374 [Corchorus capsularis]